MSTGLRELTEDDLDNALERLLAPRLVDMLRHRAPGHCMRNTDLDVALASRLCDGVRRALGPDGQVYVLAGADSAASDNAVTSTKLIELRNPDVHGDPRPPLLVFVPPGTRASAEDSFGIATFEQIELGDVYADLADHLLAELPPALRDGVIEIFGVLRERRWVYATAIARARYLLTVIQNDSDPQAAGAAIFELGLVPDFALFTDLRSVRTWTTRNLESTATLVDSARPARQRVVELQLTDPAFRARLADFLATASASAEAAGLTDPRRWARRIVVDRVNWRFSFQQWPLRQVQADVALRITVGELDLPRAGTDPQHVNDPVLQNISGQLYLPTGTHGRNVLPVSFQVEPDPRQVTGLAKFAVELVPEEGGPTGVATKVKVSTLAKSTYRANLRNLRAAGLTAGWHYVRVLPVDSEGIPLPVETTQPDQPGNESDRFFVVPDGDVDEPEPRQNRRDVGLTHALLRCAFDAPGDAVEVHHRAWQHDGDLVEVSFGTAGRVTIPLSPVLTRIQRAILANPRRLAHWRVSSGIGADSGATEAQSLAWPDHLTEVVERFHTARHSVFTAVRGDQEYIVEGCDLREIRETSREYAERYAELIAWQLRRAERASPDELPARLRELSEILRVDTIAVEHVDAYGVRSEVLLVAPTHPLRLLWLVTWAELGQRWLSDVRDQDPEAAESAQAALFQLTPTGFPLTVPRSGGRLAVAAEGPFTYWGVYLPSDTADPQDVLAGVAATLRLPDPAGQPDAGLTGRRLADRIERYLRLHPYVTTLALNAVNAGRAEHLAAALVELQGRAECADLSYDIRLFLPNPGHPDAGAALADLLGGTWSSVAEAEAFHMPVPGIVPKLSVALRPIAEFRSAAGDTSAHLTVLFDAFGGEQIDAAPAAPPVPAPVHGLRQDLVSEYGQDAELTSWRKLPRHGPAYSLPGAEELSDLLSSLPALISASTATVATGEPGAQSVPRITLSLTAQDRALIHKAHTVSDWVLTIDRTLGLDYFDEPGSGERHHYVIDHDSDLGNPLDHHVVISSRSVEELRALLDPVIRQHGFPVHERHVASFFDQLRLLSGRLAFKLASTAPTQRTEVFGLALARLYLDYQGVLSDQVLLPLDSHLDLYQETRRRADAVGERTRLHRSDLALFSLDARRRTITCRLVEVKCYSTLADPGAYQHLKDRMQAQLDGSQRVLAELFDPEHRQPDRVDRVLHNHRLATVLRFYLDRAVRHRIMHAAAAREARWLVDRLDDGYHLEFTRTGLIFDLNGHGCDTEHEGGTEFHRVGRELIQELIAAIPTDPASLTAEHPDGTTLAGEDLSVPRLWTAAFRAPSRSHDVPADDTVIPAYATAVNDGPPLPPDVSIDAVTRSAALGRDDGQPDAAADESEPSISDPTETGQPGREPAALAEGEPTIDGVPHQAVAPAVESPDTDPGSRDTNAIGTVVRPDVVLGATRDSPQFGLLGESAGLRVALDLNETHTISLFGVQGGGKSYTLGTIMEMALLPTPPVNVVPHPLATIVFHYSQTQEYAPEFTSMVEPNDDPDQVRELQTKYGIAPEGLSDVVMLVPEDQLEQRRAEYPQLIVQPLKFGSAELRAEHWRFLMGAVGNQSTYIRQLQRIMRAHRNDLRIDVIRQGIDSSGLPDHLKQLAHQRLDLATEYVDDDARIRELVRPGRMIIVDLRDEFIEKDEALGLFVVLMQLFAEAQNGGRRFNKLVVFDEAHKYIDSPDLVAGLVESVREMRHKGMSVLVASQDPPSVPISLIELSNHVILHKFTSPAWLKHLQKANAALSELTPGKMADLAPGEAYVWSSRATNRSFTTKAIKIRARQRITKHGGGTKTAVEALPPGGP
ncbi:DNA helicase HerA, contains HAS-barrel and ATPase domains [Micromonospora pallida]|uniref:DNA helicase HerA, contains HAS-barrel and ATPase domains n=1 Tax=Micromonospora pallida TaxID=145854 RepID=A0A1C6TAI7_9ACTN|nr:ATP-binding protein [Micromonospora pallida]SCL38794.1 DNA helicase HerA, contains HAS-barrel and ATPase domains [Micromonospora pallida]